MNESTFIHRIESMTNRLYRICKTILRSDADCEDAVQNAVFNAWKYIHTLRENDSFDGWMIRITINECKKLIRKRPDTQPLDENLVSDGKTAGNNDALWEIIHALDEKYRIPVELHYVENYPVRQIARILRLPEGTVKRRLHTARGLIKKDYI